MMSFYLPPSAPACEISVGSRHFLLTHASCLTFPPCLFLFSKTQENPDLLRERQRPGLRFTKQLAFCVAEINVFSLLQRSMYWQVQQTKNIPILMTHNTALIKVRPCQKIFKCQKIILHSCISTRGGYGTCSKNHG